MGSIDDFSQLCRLCLVKDQVNIPIFDETSDIGQTFLKINSCLPVKVSRDDNLPKKICDGCSYKLDMLYIFRNTSVDSEKQLISWLNQAGLSTISQTAMKDPLANTKSEIMVKQETFDATDSRIDGDHGDIGVDPQSYLMQQQQLAYQQDFDFGEPSGSNTELTDEPAPKRAKRAAALKKAPIDETDDVEDDLDAAMQITKAEEEDSEDIDQPDYVEPSTSADDQPGPSGVGKASVEAPLKRPKSLGKKGASFEYRCKLCPKTFKKQHSLRAHRATHKPKKKYMCSKCGKFLSYVGLYKHNKFFHSKKRDFSCSLCEFTCAERTVLERHKIAIHTKQYPYVCDICGAGYIEKSRFETHKKCVHEGDSINCHICNKGFNQKDSLREHMKYVHEKKARRRLSCPVCSKVMSNPSNFKIHLNTHEGVGNRFVCELCGATYASKQGLDGHRKSHTDQRDFVCDVCGKSFLRNARLVEHMRTHTKEKPYECRECGMNFAQKATLSVHMYQHTGMPYKCETCDKTFARRYLFQKHGCSKSHVT